MRDEMPVALRAVLSAKTEARFWIDHRSDSVGRLAAALESEIAAATVTSDTEGAEDSAVELTPEAEAIRDEKTPGIMTRFESEYTEFPQMIPTVLADLARRDSAWWLSKARVRADRIADDLVTAHDHTHMKLWAKRREEREASANH